MFGEPLVRGRIIRIQFHCAVIFSFGGSKIVIVVLDDLAQRSVRFRKFVVESERLQCRLLCFRHQLLRRLVRVSSQQRICVSQTRVSQRIVRILLDRLLEKRNRLLKIRGCAFVPVEAAFQIELIRFGVRRVLFV